MKDAYGWVACDHLGDVLGVEYVRLTRQEAQRVAVGHTQKTWRQLQQRKGMRR